MTIRLIFFTLLFVSCSFSWAADTAHDAPQADRQTRAFAEIGIGFGYEVLPLIGFNERSIEESTDPNLSLNITIEGRLEYKGFFLETIDTNLNNITLGYSVIDNDKGSFELIGTSLFYPLVYGDIAGLESLETRDGDFNLGFRSSHYINNTLVQLELVSDIADSHKGLIASVNLGRQKQISNWNVHGLLGIQYFSDDVVDYYFGVSPQEANELAPVYKGEEGIMPSLQLGAALPLTEKWTFNLNAEYVLLPDSVSESPLAQGSDIYLASIGFNYNFFN